MGPSQEDGTVEDVVLLTSDAASASSTVGTTSPPQAPSTGLQISLNYLMKFNAELTSNSSRDYLGGMGVMTGCDLACARTYTKIL